MFDLRFAISASLLAARIASAQCPDGTPPPCQRPARQPAAPSAPAPNSVAVLYFESLSRDTSDAYLADGLTEELTARLGQVSRLTVTSRAVVRRLRGTSAGMEMAALGQQLRAAHLVNGSVRHAGSRLRVTVELVRASSGERVWGDQYDRSDADLLGVEEDIAREVATGITGRLLPAERAALAARPTRNAAAYDLYLRGVRLQQMQNPSLIPRAIEAYAAALQLDSAFTAARAKTALAYSLALNYNQAPPGVPRESLSVLGSRAADRALREDSTASDAWLARASLEFYQQPRDPQRLFVALRRAIALDPNNPDAHVQFATTLRRFGRLTEGEREYRRALELVPTLADALADLGFIAATRRHSVEALRWYDSVVSVSPSGWFSLTFRSKARLYAGDVVGALDDARAAVRLADPNGQELVQSNLALAEARSGDTAAARTLLEALLTSRARGGSGADSLHVRDYDLAQTLVALGDTSRALEVLERIRPRGAWLWSYLVFPGFDPIRAHPRFQRVYREARPPGAERLPGVDP